MRSDLDAAAYTGETIEDLLGVVATAALHREQAVPARRALRGSTEPAAVLLRVFVLGDAVRRSVLDGALPRLRAEGSLRAGLVRVSGGSDDDLVVGAVDLTPYTAQDAAGIVRWWIASDVGELASGRPLDPDHVLGVGGASTTLARITVREPVGRALDLGTGSGIQALHAGRHARSVVATDVSARALAFARLNAGLAAAELDLRHGSMFEPVAGEAFDLVVSNPPFVITPRAEHGAPPRYSYRDGGLVGDDLVRSLVLGVGQALAPGGVAQLLGSWEHRRGEGWADRVSGWLEASGLDGWVVQREVADPAEYAETWLRDGGLTPDRDPGGWRASYEAWLDDFDARGVEAVGFGYVTLRRPLSGPASLRRVESHEASLPDLLGDHVAEVLRAHDWLRATSDRDLADARLVVRGDVTEERHLAPGDADPRVVLLRQGEGLARVASVGPALAGLVGACDGELTVGQVVGALARLTGTSAPVLAAELLPQVRDLVRDGFLEAPRRGDAVVRPGR